MVGFNLVFTSFPITVLAVYDKEVTYEYIMNEQEERHHYRERDFQTIDPNNSYIPSSSVKIMPLIKKNFQYLYHTTQQSWDFNWKIFFVEIINALAQAVILCTLIFSVCSGTSIQHQDGYTYDFWMASFTIYGSLVYITNLVIVMRSGQITWFVMFWVAFFSIIPFLTFSLIFDTVMNIENGSQYILLNMGSTYHYYLVCIVMTFIVYYFEVMRTCIRVFWKPRLSDYFRLLIKREKQDDPTKFDREFLISFSELNNPIQKRKIDKAMRRTSTQLEANQLRVPSVVIEPIKELSESSSKMKRGDFESVEKEDSVDSPKDRVNALPFIFKKKNSANKVVALNGSEPKDLKNQHNDEPPMLQAPIAKEHMVKPVNDSLPSLVSPNFVNLRKKSSAQSKDNQLN